MSKIITDSNFFTNKVINKTIEKRCCVCKRVKLYSEFYKSRSRNKYDGYATQCKPCGKMKVKEWGSKNPDKIRLQHTKRRKKKKETADPRFYAMQKLGSSRELAKKRGGMPCTATISDLEELFTTECQICDKECGTAIHLDHCHATGQFRGFICGACNTILGCARDNVDILKKCIEYLLR